MRDDETLAAAAGGEWLLLLGGTGTVALLDVVKGLELRGREAGGKGVLRKGGRLGAEAGRVGRRLHAQLGEVEVGPGLVAHVHGLEQLALGPVAVEDDAVERDTDDLDNDFDDHADKTPVLFNEKKSLLSVRHSGCCRNTK